MPDRFEVLQEIIHQRHTTKPARMNGEQIDDSVILQLLQLADRAPTHARTEPWRFMIYRGESLLRFCEAHAGLYWAHTDPDVRNQEKYEKIRNQYKTVSHLIITVMKRTEAARIPAEEEYAAVCAAVEHILLGCEALGLAAIWSTGGMTHKAAFRSFLNLAEQDRVVALIFVGKSDERLPPVLRRIPLEEKINWI